MRSQQTRWLTPAEQLAWRTFLTACQRLFGAIDAQLLHDSQIPHGSPSLWLGQLSTLARMRAVEVLPVPRGPLKR